MRGKADEAAKDNSEEDKQLNESDDKISNVDTNTPAPDAVTNENATSTDSPNNLLLLR